MPDLEPDRTVEFVERDGSPARDVEPLALPSRPRWTVPLAAGGGTLVAALLLVTLVSHRDHGAADASSSRSGPTALPVAEVPSTPPPELTAFPPGPLRSAVAASCAGIRPCSARRGDSRTAAAARRVFGTTRDLQVRRAGGHRALIVGVLTHGDAQLLAIATTPGVHVDPTRLHIAPPIAVQTQHNGDDLLTVVVSGSPTAVALLGSSRIQRWLALLSPG